MVERAIFVVRVDSSLHRTGARLGAEIGGCGGCVRAEAGGPTVIIRVGVAFVCQREDDPCVPGCRVGERDDGIPFIRERTSGELRLLARCCCRVEACDRVDGHELGLIKHELSAGVGSVAFLHDQRRVAQRASCPDRITLRSW